MVRSISFATAAAFWLASQGVFGAPGDVLFQEDFNTNLNQWTVSEPRGDANIDNKSANQGNSLELRWGEASVTSDVIDTSVPSASVSVWIRRGADSFSEDPDGGEDLFFEYLNDTGSWVILESFRGEDAPGELFVLTYFLPSAGLHSNFRLRLRTTGNDGPDWDYWHVDDVVVTEAVPANGFAVNSCEDFESGLGDWTVASFGGDAGVSAATASSGNSSLFTRWNAVTVTGPVTDLSGFAAVNLDLWVRKGDDSFSEDPNPGEDLVVEYLDNNSNWVILQQFLGSEPDGQIFTPSYTLPANAYHAGFQIRFRQTNGSDVDWDYWHVDDVCLVSPLAAAYSFEEDPWAGSSGEIQDGSGNSLDGTVFGGAGNDSSDPAISGDPGTCRYADFDGIDDYVQVPDAAPLDIANELTVAAWINMRSYPGDLHTIVSKDWNYEYHVNSAGEIYWWWNDDSEQVQTLTSTGTSLTLDQWYHVAITYESGSQNIYINGTSVASSAVTGRLRTNDVELFIGTDWNFISRAFDGLIDEVRILAQVLDATEVTALMNETHPCPFVNAEFQINHDGYGIHCLGEVITVNVLDVNAGTPLTSYNNTVTLDSQSGFGSWQLVSGGGTLSDSTADDGLATYDWPLGETQAVFRLNYGQGAAVIDIDVFQTDDTSIRDDDSEGAITFSPNGFLVTASALPNPPGTAAPFDQSQVSAVGFNLHLTAYGQTPSDPVCGVIESYTGRKGLKFWQAFSDPSTGFMTAEVAGGNAATSEASAIVRSVSFSAGQAVTAAVYRDVGEIQLLLKDDVTVNPELPSGIRGATANFVVKPFGFELSQVFDAPGTTANPAATDATGPVFLAAGAPFRMTVTALNADGDPTPNFGREFAPETVALTTQLLAPSGGSAPTVTGATGFAAFANGESTGTDFVWPEVGIIEVTPRLGDGDYLGAGDTVGTAYGPIGRFVPDRFQVNQNVPLFSTGCTSGGFTYLGEEFGYSIEPEITASALAVGGTPTLNYTGDFFKINTNTLQNRNYQTAQGALDLSGLPASNIDPTVTESAPGTALIVFSSGTGLAYQRNAPEAPFDANIQLSIDLIDDDGVTPAANPVAFGAGLGMGFSDGAAMRYGRIRLANAVGSELVNLAVPMVSEYYMGTAVGFVANTDDTCSTDVALTFANFSENLQSGETCVLDTGNPGDSNNGCPTPAANPFSEPPLAGDFNLNLAAPGTGNGGGLDVTALVPDWLKFDWNNALAGDEDPSAQVTFGIFSGEGSHIYLREIY